MGCNVQPVTCDVAGHHLPNRRHDDVRPIERYPVSAPLGDDVASAASSGRRAAPAAPSWPASEFVSPETTTIGTSPNSWSTGTVAALSPIDSIWLPSASKNFASVQNRCAIARTSDGSFAAGAMTSSSTRWSAPRLAMKAASRALPSAPAWARAATTCVMRNRAA